MKSILCIKLFLLLSVNIAQGSASHTDRPLQHATPLPTLVFHPVSTTHGTPLMLDGAAQTSKVTRKLSSREMRMPTFSRDLRSELYDWQFGPRKSHHDIAAYIFSNGVPDGLLQHFPFLDELSTKALSKSNDFLDKMGQEGKILTSLAGIQKAKFPVALKKEVNGVEVLIGIENIEYSHSVATMKNIFVRLQYPNYSLVFGAPEVKFSRTGGFIEAKLGLIGDIPIPINGDDKTLLIFRGYDYVTKDGSYITIDCDGVKSGSLLASVFVSDKLIYPINSAGERDKGFVYGTVGIALDDLNDFRGIVSFDKAFKINGIDKVSFRLSNAIFDGSEKSNDGRVRFPAGYLSDGENHGLDPENWQGLFIEELAVKVDFSDLDIKDEVGAEVRGLLIDRFGVTGDFSAVNLLPFDQGRIGNVNFSVDALSFGIQKSQLESLTCTGKVGIPAISNGENQEASLTYIGNAHGALWSFNAAVLEEVEFPFPLTKSSVILRRGTTLEIGKDQTSDNTLVQVSLCGKTDIAKILPRNESDEGKQITAIHFENFIVQSANPTIKEIGVWSIPSQLEMPFGPFKLSLEDVMAGKSQAGETFLHFTAGAAFSNRNAFSISSKVGISIFGRHHPTDHVLRYDRTTVDRVDLCIGAKSWGAKVGLHWFEEDPIYGNGFKGIAAVGIAAMGYKPSDNCSMDAGIFASALFGNVDTTRFYNFELLYINLEKGIPLGPLALHGVGGAISNNLEVSGLDDFGFAQAGLEESAEEMNSQAQTVSSDSHLGESLLGLHYKPSVDAGFNLRLMTIAASNGSSKIVNMSAELNFAFNSNSGLDSISLDIQGQMFIEMTLLKRWEMEVPAQFDAYVLYDNINKIFTLGANVDINVENEILGGGRINFYADEHDWYLHVGQPGVAGNIGLLIPMIGGKTNAYFCAGNTNVPDMPLLPKEIRNVFPSAGSSKRAFDVSNDLSGLAFGAHFGLGSPAEKSLLLFYYKLHVLVGFDVNVRNYERYLCSGVEEFGLRKWYAKGQVYAYIDGAIGLQSGGKKFPIMELRTALKIYLETPRPTYGEFGVSVKYKILGGLIKGRAKVEATFGEQCQFEKGNIDIDVFSDVIKPNNPESLGVTEDLTISGGVPFEQIFSEDDLGETLLKVSLRDVIESKQSGWSSSSTDGYAYYNFNGETIPIPCRKIYSEDRTFVTYSPEELWPPNTEVWIHPRADYSQSSDEGLSWKLVSDQNGSTSQDSVYRFRTGSYPDHVPVDNISWTYPVNGMSNFYEKEMNEQGFIQLHKSMSYLFENGAPSAEITCHTDQRMSFEVPLSYDSETKRIVWNLPSDKMRREGIYTIDFKSATGMIAEPIHFRCSAFSSLEEKLAEFGKQTVSLFIDPENAVHRQLGMEKFDELELFGNGMVPPLIQMDFNTSDLIQAYGPVDSEELDLEKNLYISTELQFYSSFQDRPRIRIKTPDQLGERPYYEDVQGAAQFFNYAVHLKYIELRQSLLDLVPPAEQKDPRPLHEIFRHPSQLRITWRYGIKNELKSSVRMQLKTSQHDMY